jgi:hypothetical protein
MSAWLYPSGRIIAALIAAVVLAAGCGPSPSAEASVGASIESIVPLAVERGVRDPMGAAIGIRDGGCATSADIDYAAPNLAAVDLAIVGAGGAWGIYDAGRGRQAYYGPVEGAARAFGATAMFVGATGETWIRTAPGEARQLTAYQTPANRAIWMMGNASQIAPCGQGTP